MFSRGKAAPLCMQRRHMWNPMRLSPRWCVFQRFTRSLWLCSNFGPFPFHEYVCNRVRSSLYFSLWAQSKRYIATKHKNLMSSAFPKEPTYITCQRRTRTGEATHTNIHTHAQGFYHYFQHLLRTFVTQPQNTFLFQFTRSSGGGATTVERCGFSSQLTM